MLGRAIWSVESRRCRRPCYQRGPLLLSIESVKAGRAYCRWINSSAGLFSDGWIEGDPMSSVLRFVLPLLSAAILFAPQVHAQTQDQIDWCRGKGVASSSPELMISGCTAVIRGGRKVNNDSLAAIFSNRAYAYRKKGEYNRAIQDYDQAIKLAPNLANAFNGRGTTFRDKGEYDRAIQDYDQVIQLKPNDAVAFNNRCWTRALAGQLEQALNDCDESLRLKPDNAHTLDVRGFVYLKSERFDDAIKDYSAALRLDAKRAYALYGRAWAYQKTGKQAEADADIAAAMAIDPKIEAQFVRFGVN
jgi:tetratricopeptide (TPR) repeat protein